MTPVGHTLTGLSIGLAFLPRSFSVRSKVCTLSVFALLANLPDLPVPGRDRFLYEVSHSIFLNLAGVLSVILLLRLLPSTRRRIPPLLLLGGALAWISHLLLDTLYGRYSGLAVLWPFSDHRVSFPVPWFDTLHYDRLLSRHNVRVALIEAAVYGSLLMLTALLRVCFFRMKKKGALSAGSLPDAPCSEK